MPGLPLTRGAVASGPVSTAEGYDGWAPGYDEPNDLIDLEQPVVREILDRLPAGRALDAACGTGRYADVSPGMLAMARANAPGGDFREADLARLPVPSQHVDLMVDPAPDGTYRYLTNYQHATSEYLSAALPRGLQVLSCEELRHPWKDPADAPPPERVRPDHPSDIWTLKAWCPAAHQAADNGRPMLIFWHFQLAGR
jgi:SAM-dependent methyltransferase